MFSSKNIFLPLIVGVGLLSSATTVNAQDYCTDAPVDGEAYLIVSVGANKLMAGQSSQKKANVELQTNNGSKLQRFYLKYQSSSHYWAIQSADNSYAATVESGSTSNGATIQQKPFAGSSSQEWELKQVTSGTYAGSYKIVNRKSALSLSVAGSSDGSDIYQNADVNNSSQRWWLEPVTFKCSGSDAAVTGTAVSGDGQVKLSWTAPGNGSTFQIYQDTDSTPKGRVRIAALPSTTLSYTATGLTNGQTYYFWVKYTRSDGTYANSPVFSATPKASINTSIPTVDGFAAQTGEDGLSTTTGGGNATPTVVKTCSQLTSALSDDAARVVHIPDNTTIDCHAPTTTVEVCKIKCASSNKYTYRVPLGVSCTSLGSDTDSTVTKNRNDTRVQVKSNKTILGLGSGSAVSGAAFNLQNSKNIIFRNFTIEDINPGLIEASGGISINNASHIWIDHMQFRNISDGYADMKYGKNITLSWNHFDGAAEGISCDNQHPFIMYADYSLVTYHHNFYDTSSGRNPKLNHSTKAHLYNNYWKDISFYSMSAGDGSQAKVEGNYYENSRYPHWNNDGTGLIDADIKSNRYTGKSATDGGTDSGSSVFGDINLYPYSLDDVDTLPKLLTDGTGPQ